MDSRHLDKLSIQADQVARSCDLAYVLLCEMEHHPATLDHVRAILANARDCAHALSECLDMPGVKASGPNVTRFPSGPSDT